MTSPLPGHLNRAPGTIGLMRKPRSGAPARYPMTRKSCFLAPVVGHAMRELSTQTAIWISGREWAKYRRRPTHSLNILAPFGSSSFVSSGSWKVWSAGLSFLLALDPAALRSDSRYLPLEYTATPLATRTYFLFKNLQGVSFLHHGVAGLHLDLLGEKRQ